jgi:prepilin-type N-terminal cleavage/methylation domain-containing protein
MMKGISRISFLKREAKDQRGFTLIEIAISLLITAALSFGIVSATSQITGINSLDNAHVIAVKQVENAIHYLNRDVQMSQKVEIDGAGYWLRLTWTSWGTPTATPPVPPATTQIIYNVDGEGNLVRNDGSTAMTVAKFITAKSAVLNTDILTIPAKKWYTIKISVTATAGPKQATETREVEIIPRPGS